MARPCRNCCQSEKGQSAFRKVNLCSNRMNRPWYTCRREDLLSLSEAQTPALRTPNEALFAKELRHRFELLTSGFGALCNHRQLFNLPESFVGFTLLAERQRNARARQLALRQETTDRVVGQAQKTQGSVIWGAVEWLAFLYSDRGVRSASV